MNNRNWGETDPDKRDSPIYYDNVMDEKGNIIGRRYYVAIGTDVNYTKDTKRADVKNSNSFEKFIETEGGKKQFFEIENLENVPVFREEDARKKTELYTPGTIVKIIRSDNTEEYYIVNKASKSVTKLCDLFEESKTDNGWWRLDILP